MARRNAIRSIAPESRRSVLPISSRRDGDSDETGPSRDTGGVLRRRIFISTVLTAIRYNQVEKAESHRKEPTLRNTCKKASCVRSSASAISFVISRHTEYTRFLWSWKSVAKASSSPRCARCTRLRSESSRLVISLAGITSAAAVAEITQVATVVSFVRTRVLVLLSMIPGASTSILRLPALLPAAHQDA